MSYRLGVDLGTTFTAAAVANGMPPTMVGLGNRALQIPSVLFLAADDTLLFGEAAERRGLAEPDRVAREFKRRIGDTVPILIAGRPFSPQALTSRLLQHVVHTATERMGEPPEEVVLTHPANWGPYKLDLLDQAARLAGVERATRCPEPLAAAAQYAAQTRVAVGDTIAVYDLGGGTFDACVLEKTDTGFALLGTPEGIEHLGGIDFDEALFQHVLGLLGDRLSGVDPDDPAAVAGLARLRRDCVEAKEALSADTDTTLSVVLPGVSATLRLTRSEFEGLIRPALEDTVGALERAMRSAGRTPDQLRAIVLVGGSSRIPLIGELLQSSFSIPTALDTHPKHDVALGAVQATSGAAGATPTATQDDPTSGTRHSEHLQPGEPRAVALPAAASRAAPQSGATAHVPSTPGSPKAQTSASSPETQAPSAPPAPDQPTDSAIAAPVSAPPSGGSPVPTSERLGRRRLVILGSSAAAVIAGLVLTAAAIRSLGSGDEASGGLKPSESSTPSASSPSTTPTASSRGPATPASLPRSEPLTATQMLIQMNLDGREDIWVGDTTRPDPVRRLTQGPGFSSGMDIAPAFDSMIYLRSDAEGNHDLWVSGVQNIEGARELFPRPDGCLDIKRPAWDPVDPTRLAVPCIDTERRYTIHVMTVDGTEIGRVTPPPGLPRLDDVVFSADGQRLAFWAAPDSDELDGGVLYTVPVDGGTPRALIKDDTSPIEGQDADPAYSPDGAYVAFRRRVPAEDGKGQFDIYRVRVDGTGLTRLTDDPAAEQNPSWSPDSRQIAYKSAVGATPRLDTRIWTMTADGDDQQPLWTEGSPGPQQLVAWAPR